LQDINALWHNKTLATDFLFKGTKELAAVGTFIDHSPEDKKDPYVLKSHQDAFSSKQGGLDFTSMFKAAAEKGP
jgi:hypothetical protein